jgi:uroporphyrinogen decarboxylase
MLAALEYAHPDRIPVVYHPSPAGLHVHGQQLLDLFNAYPPDNPVTFDEIPGPPPGTVAANGRYHEIRTDEWRSTYEWRIFGLNGHPKRYPITNMAEAKDYEFPPVPAIGSPAFEVEKARVDAEREKYLAFRGDLSLFERLCALYSMSQVLIDLALGDRHLLSFLDRMVEHWLDEVEYYLAMGVDGIWFFDDWGTQNSQIISPKLFHQVFIPRYRQMMAPIKRAGVKILFHSCGCLGTILDELIDLGVDLMWPQIPLYDDTTLAQKCQEHGVTIYIHPDRQRLIPLGTPAEIETEIQKYSDRYHDLGGGGIFYVEIENDAPFENVKALIEAMHRYR